MVDLKVFTLEGCSHCVQLLNYLEENNIKFERLDLLDDNDKTEKLIKKFNIKNFPTLFFVKDNKIKDIKIGFDKEKDNIFEYLNEVS